MIKKYFVRIDDVVLALKWDTTNRIVTLGGNVRYQILMETIISDGFQRHPKVKPKNTQINKIRFTFKKNGSAVRETLDWFKENGYTLEETTNLQNVMR